MLEAWALRFKKAFTAGWRVLPAPLASVEHEDRRKQSRGDCTSQASRAYPAPCHPKHHRTSNAHECAEPCITRRRDTHQPFQIQTADVWREYTFKRVTYSCHSDAVLNLCLHRHWAAVPLWGLFYYTYSTLFDFFFFFKAHNICFLFFMCVLVDRH